MYKPTKICIAGIRFKIEYCDMDGLLGLFLPGDNIIKICNGLSDEERFSTLMHECIHAIFDITGNAYSINDSAKEESIVRALENLFFAVFIREYEKTRTTKT